MESSETEQPPGSIHIVQNVPPEELEDLGIGEELVENPHELQDEDLGIYEDEDDGTDISDLDLKNKGQNNKEDGKYPEDTERNVVDENSVHVSVVEQPKVTETDSMVEVSRADIHDDVSSLQTASAALQKNLSVSIQPIYTEKERGLGGQMSEMSIESRNASRLPSESREAIYRRAMMLLSTRCASVSRGTLEPYNPVELPYGAFAPEYFYINQQKPTPMQPLKAWRGYGGNVYFEPIHIKSMNNNERAVTAFCPPIPMSRHGDKPQTSHFPSRANANTPRTERPTTNSSINSRQTNASSASDTKKLPLKRQLVILDKRAVLTRFNNNLKEDLVWIDSTESTGSLAVRPRSERVNGTTAYNRDKICKGSVVHKLYEANRQSKSLKLKVSGDKFNQPMAMSPLLRTQTQYSLSGRLTTNSPEMCRPDRLPPLEQLRASLQQVGTNKNFRSPLSFGHGMTVIQDLKPFIKYSPDIKNRFEHQEQLC
ncbi:hypothetical protein ScPMuIL_010084 [Solemya velum]